jgi:hypothetical protein
MDHSAELKPDADQGPSVWVPQERQLQINPCNCRPNLLPLSLESYHPSRLGVVRSSGGRM